MTGFSILAPVFEVFVNLETDTVQQTYTFLFSGNAENVVTNINLGLLYGRQNGGTHSYLSSAVTAALKLCWREMRCLICHR